MLTPQVDKLTIYVAVQHQSMPIMEGILKKALKVSYARAGSGAGGGCISDGRTYETDRGKFFVKINHKSEVCQ